MARQNHGPLSRAKGKLGGVVYQQYEGMQIAREYQPVVKNPQTSKQTLNRSKFKLASQITAQFFYVLNQRFTKLSIYTRMRRAAAVNALYSTVNATQPDEPELLVASAISALNAKSMQDFVAPTIDTATQGQAKVIATSGDVVFATVVSYDGDGNFASKTDETYTSDGSAKSFSASTETNVIMVVALRATTDAGRATLTNTVLSADGSATDAWMLDIERGVAAGEILVSGLAGVFFSN